MLVDTDVLIWHLRGNSRAALQLDALDILRLSSVSYLEILQGLRSKAELVAVKQMLVQRSAAILPLTESITERATVLMEALVLSHGLQLGDALIAATAIEHQLPLLTANVRHFRAIGDLPLRAFTP